MNALPGLDAGAPAAPAPPAPAPEAEALPLFSFPETMPGQLVLAPNPTETR